MGQSMNTNSLSSKHKGGDQEKLHMVYNKPKIFDKSKNSKNKSISNNDQDLFAMAHEDFITPKKGYDDNRKSYNNATDGQYKKNTSSGGGIRPRMNTASQH